MIPDHALMIQYEKCDQQVHIQMCNSTLSQTA